MIGIQGVFKNVPKFYLRGCGTIKAIKKNCSSKIKCQFIFWQDFLNIFSEFYMKPVARG
jgi:hypothetical protein